MPRIVAIEEIGVNAQGRQFVRPLGGRRHEFAYIQCKAHRKTIGVAVSRELMACASGRAKGREGLMQAHPNRQQAMQQRSVQSAQRLMRQ